MLVAVVSPSWFSRTGAAAFGQRVVLDPAAPADPLPAAGRGP